MFDDIINKLKGLKGIEFGGPTELFYNNDYRMNLYDNVYLDGGNLLDDDSFSNLKGHGNKTKSYVYGEKNGRQYNIDCANIKIGQLNKYDFIVTSHVIEHIANPIKAIKNWKNILNIYNGYVLSIIPDYKFSFDRKRPLTKIKHLIHDYINDIGEDDKTHIEEQKKLHDWSLGGHPNFYKLCDNNHKTKVVHHHTFDINLVDQMFEYCDYEVIVSYKHDNLNIVNLSKIKKNN